MSSLELRSVSNLNMSQSAPTSVGLFLLGGGQSRRFGTDKASFEFEGTPLAVRIARRLSPLFGEATLVVREQTDTLAGLGLPLLADLMPGNGPLGGLHAALQAGHREHLTLCVACDMPWVDAQLLLEQVERLRALPERLACVPFLDGRWHPLHGVYRGSALGVVEALLAAGQLKLQRACEELDAIDILETSAAPLERWHRSVRNANTLDDLSAK